jgi:hypothetical protein
MNKWSNEEIETLVCHYPTMGKMWCANTLHRSESSVRWKASELKLTLSKDSEFFKEWQNRAAKSKVGKKRPDQALVIQKLHKEGKLVKTKKQKEAMSIRFKNWHSKNTHPKGMLGKVHTKETKEILSKKSSEYFNNETDEQQHERVLKMMKTKEKNGTMVSERQKTTWKAAWHEIGGVRKYYRSRWEANYAYYLQWLKENNQIKDWKHEPKTFWFDNIKRGTVSYLPDFWVQELNDDESYHEVKGWMDSRSITKIKRMAKYHPNIKLIVIDAKAYKELAKKASLFVKEWSS